MKKALSILFLILFSVYMCIPAYAYDTQDGMTVTVNDQGGGTGDSGQVELGAGDSKSGEQGDVDNQGGGSGGSDQVEPGAGDTQSGEQGDVDNQGGESGGSDQVEPGAGDNQSVEQGDVDNQGGGSDGSGQVETGSGDSKSGEQGDVDNQGGGSDGSGQAEPGAGDTQSGGQGDIDNQGGVSVVGDVYDPGTGGQDVEIEEPVIVPPVIPEVEMPVTAQRTPAFKFVGSGVVKTTLTATEPSTVKLLSVTGIPKSINIRVFVDNVKVAEVIGGSLENSQEFYIENGSKDVEFVISGYGDMSKSNMNFLVL